MQKIQGSQGIQEAQGTQEIQGSQQTQGVSAIQEAQGINMSELERRLSVIVWGSIIGICALVTIIVVPIVVLRNRSALLLSTTTTTTHTINSSVGKSLAVDLCTTGYVQYF
jgi:hypothetical protein